MIDIRVTDDFSLRCPQFVGAAIAAQVVNAPTPTALWDNMQTCCNTIAQQYTTDTLKERPGIAATRTAYKTFGKDPSRYRPACEQLARRVVQGKSLNSVDTLADISNIVSICSGYSTAALDAEKIDGNSLCLGIGRNGEPYEGIGRGVLNIENLPVYRDKTGGVATPTSDNTRTMTTEKTQQLLFLINAYDGNTACLQEAVQQTISLLQQHAQATEVQVCYYGNTSNL